MCLGVAVDGAWASYVQVPLQQCHILPDDLPTDVAALCEPMSCILRGADRIGRIPSGSRILVIGAGIIGLLWCSLLHFR